MGFLCQKCKKNWGSPTSFQRKRVENYPACKKLAHVIQHGLQGFIVKNIEGEPTEANYLNPSRDIWNRPTDEWRAKKNGVRWGILQKIHTSNR